MRTRPHVGGVERHEHRHVTDYLDALRVRVTLEIEPLAEEEVLEEALRRDAVGQLAPGLGQRAGLAMSERGSPGPPARAVVAVLECGEQRVVVEPRGGGSEDALVVLPEPLVSLHSTLEMMERLLEQAALVGRDTAIVVGHPTEVGRVFDVRGLEQAGGHEASGADEVHVACEGRGGRVGRAAPPHGSQRHELPEGLAGGGEEIDETVGFLTEVAGAEGPRERRGMEKNPARALEFHTALGVEGCGAVRTQVRSTSATLQAWATQPRGV